MLFDVLFSVAPVTVAVAVLVKVLGNDGVVLGASTWIVNVAVAPLGSGVLSVQLRVEPAATGLTGAQTKLVLVTVTGPSAGSSGSLTVTLLPTGIGMLPMFCTVTV